MGRVALSSVIAPGAGAEPDGRHPISSSGCLRTGGPAISTAEGVSNNRFGDESGTLRVGAHFVRSCGRSEDARLASRASSGVRSTERGRNVRHGRLDSSRDLRSRSRVSGVPAHLASLR